MVLCTFGVAKVSNFSLNVVIVLSSTRLVIAWGSKCWHGLGSLVKLEGRVDSTAYQQILEKHMLTDAAALIGRLCLPAGQRANPHVSVNKTMATPA